MLDHGASLLRVAHDCLSVGRQFTGPGSEMTGLANQLASL